ncbi:MAG: hypothetical protein AMXMBFR7_47450 [Planctomycetota bacterium]
MAHFGATLRLLRAGAGIGLRELAQRIGVSGAYLSRVEHGHDAVPTPDRLLAIARELDVPPPLLLELAEQTGPAVSSYVKQEPAAGALFLEIAKRDLRAPDLARVRAFLDREFPTGRPKTGDRASLRQLLSAERVVAGLECQRLDDLVEVAVSRLSWTPSPSPGQLVQQVLAREAEAPSMLGFGVYAPHAVVRGAAPAAVLLSLGWPLPFPTPDGQPIRMAVFLLSGQTGRPHLNALVQVARLARGNFAEAIRGLTSPARILARLEAWEAC